MDSKRVALLARAGTAREQLRFALHEAGAEIVLEDDPAAIDLQTLQDVSPQAVLVALEPAIEDALVRLEPLLHDASVRVIFDEADLAARREGWEAQRWARHLSAKLHGHSDVLPPGREEDTLPALEPGRPRQPAQEHVDAMLDVHVDEAHELALDLPSDDYSFSLPASRGNTTLVDADQWLRQASAGDEPAPAGQEVINAASSADEVAGSTHPETPAAAVAAPGKWELSLEPLEPVSTSTARCSGAVIAFAGIGGPDAVRKLLAALPLDFVRPVLIHLQLDGGRYDNLVKQLARVTEMPVQLAEHGKPAEPAHVYVLPNDVGLDISNGAVSFREGGELREDLLQLPPADSAVLLLSGSDKGLVGTAASLAGQGALVMGQSQEGCYDPGAALALAAHGASLAAPAVIAQRLAGHWSR
ncbi:hypothetical protein ABB29_01390 [Pseudoxanthomonas dokdonensis]|uniref:protein-glutamate methylesterase n=1 Tax=Pseudoxanthomonas dokdonensis TaxID=344882 RepID=A0A0R0CZU0_9GAMM|nr:hypothetical protein ABB29_01390 [Pseudoxanthomonas dokdonensis]